jgi:hypothetical protein
VLVSVAMPPMKIRATYPPRACACRAGKPTRQHREPSFASAGWKIQTAGKLIRPVNMQMRRLRRSSAKPIVQCTQCHNSELSSSASFEFAKLVVSPDCQPAAMPGRAAGTEWRDT